MADLYTVQQLPATSQAALREFDERYLMAVGAAPPAGWAQQYGDVINTASPFTTYPISQLGMKFVRAEGEARFKTLAATSFDVKVVEYRAGIEAELLKLQTDPFSYRQWQNAPSRFVIGEQRHVVENIVTLLEDGVNQDCWDGKKFFATDHPANKFEGTASFSNYQSSTKDVTDMTKLEEEVTLMRGVLDENGKKLGVEPDTIVVPTAKYQKLVNKLAQDMLLEGSATAPTSNPFKGKFQVVHAPELTDADDWYLIDSSLMARSGMAPWAILKYSPAGSLQTNQWDESSDFFKDTHRIKVSQHIWYGFALVMPHAIRLVKGA
jgi:hypothetical protein